MARILMLSKDDYPTLNGLLQGQDVQLRIRAEVLDDQERHISMRIDSLQISSKRSQGTHEIVQQLAKNRAKMQTTTTVP